MHNMADPGAAALTIEEQHKIQHKIDRTDEIELTRLQREYRNYANNKFAVRGNESQKKILDKNLEINKRELREIRTNLLVAKCKVYTNETEHHMAMLTEHVAKQESIVKVIDTIKLQVVHMNLQLKRLHAKRFEVNKMALTDQQYGSNLLRSTRVREILENRLDVSRRQECTQIEINTKLRAYVDHMLCERILFNKLWQRMIVQLSFDKKFLIDMVDRAVLAFNLGADLCNQLDALHEKSERDKKNHITEMLDMIRKLDADDKLSTFLRVKGQTRHLNDLERREYIRRENVRDQYDARSKFYKIVIDRVIQFQGVADIQAAIEKFVKSDDEYFAHFNYMNNLTDQIQFLGECLCRMYRNIDGLREYNSNKELYQKKNIENLKQQYEAMKKDSIAVIKRDDESAKRLNMYLLTINDLFAILKCDSRTLDVLLSDQTKTTIHNVNQYLSLLESRLNTVLNYVYDAERKSGKPGAPKVVRGVTRDKTEPTAMEDVVLVQQCAECAEGEVNRYDEEIVYPMEKDEVLTKVRIKTNAPEIQYRLHNISKCRLPRSRALVNKRYQ